MLYIYRMGEMTASEARARLPEILDRVEAGEDVTITRHGRVAAVVTAPDSVRNRRPAAVAAMERAKELGRRLETARNQPLTLSDTMTARRAEQLVRELREERDSS